MALRRMTLTLALLLAVCGTVLVGCATPEVKSHDALTLQTTAPSTATTAVATTIPVPTTEKRLARASRSLQGGVRTPVGGDIWRALANCESALGNDSKSGKYHGYFQFSLATWQSVGGTGDPHTYTYEEQLHFAQILQARSGWGQWPVCSRKLGLR